MKGFTLLEAIMVIAVIVVLGTIGIEVFVSFKAKQESQSAVSGVVSLLEDARVRTIGSLQDVAYGVYIDDVAAHLFKTTATATPIGGTVQFPDSFVVTVSLAGGGNAVLFSRLTGETSQNGTIIIARENLSTSTLLRIHQTGIVDIE